MKKNIFFFIIAIIIFAVAVQVSVANCFFDFGFQRARQRAISSGDAVLWDASGDAVLWDASGDKVLWD